MWTKISLEASCVNYWSVKERTERSQIKAQYGLMFASTVFGKGWTSEENCSQKYRDASFRLLIF